MDDTPRPINVFTRYSNLLPNYIIESGDSKIKCCCWKRKSQKMKCDFRPIKIHLTINKQIEKIINIVIITLKELNEKKLKLLISMAHNINVLRTILVRPANQNYLTELLKSKLVLNNSESETECCTLMKGSNEMIRDVNKYKKNMVFRLNPPNSLVYLRALLADMDKYTSCPEIQKKDSFCSLVDICKKISVGEDVNLAGFSILRNTSINSSGTAVISEDGKDITYIAGPSCKKTRAPDFFENNLTLLLKSTGLMDKKTEEVKPVIREEKFMRFYHKMSDRTIASLEKITKERINTLKSHMNKTKDKKEPPDPEMLRSNILKRLSNQQRILLAQESSRVKGEKNESEHNANVAPLAHIMSNVMSKRSLLNLARNSTQEEREYFLKPVKKGGLGLGEIIIGKENMSKMEKIAAIAQGETLITMITPLSEQVAPAPERKSIIDVSTDSSWDLLKIKHDISQAEITKKFTKFVKSNSESHSSNHHEDIKYDVNNIDQQSKQLSPNLTIVETKLQGRIPLRKQLEKKTIVQNEEKSLAKSLPKQLYSIKQKNK
ncbi:uncharacterized protein LOC106668671 isoform X2 [Cimex lectularius]|uniref:Uncharacterized protein n=1 Tax=Cimex lectularius TaxID=79782 RepID=A0A8I6SF03_CIMLE|nr:uncharacterized protein LOC106668671 isoform X2 [Cimex lectularius]